MAFRTLAEVHHAYAEGVREYRGAYLRAKAFKNVTFQGCHFVNCTFDEAELLGGGFEGSHFERTTLRGTRFYGTASLVDTTFVDCELDAARLRQMTVTRCDFIGSPLPAARMTGVTFVECTFRRTALDGAKLQNVDFRGCRFEGVTFAGAELRGVTFVNCYVGAMHLEDTLLLSCDLANVADGGETVKCGRNVVVDWRSVCRSLRSPLLYDFLVRAGIPEVFVHYLVDCARAIDPHLLFKLMQSTFISYGTPDVEFARQLHRLLEQNGVKTYLFETHATPGERLHRTMYEGINEHDRVILICSEKSLTRKGVRNEIEETFARESRDGGASYLIPITRDDYIFTWDDELGVRIRDRVVADFRGVESDRAKFNASFHSLLRALRAKIVGA